MKKKISILGSTGSIGQSTLKIIDKKKDFFKIIFLSSNKNYPLICKQIKIYKPNYYIIKDPKTFRRVQKKFKKNKIKLINEFDLKNLKIKSDIVVSAIPGIAGLEPTLNIIKTTKKLLIANKESIICGWNLIQRMAKKYKSEIIPVDSEHFSILQLIKNKNISEIDRIFITASGGPFLNFKITQLKNIKPKDALKHPKWKMGKKVTVDSSTLMNKVLELIEAHKIFNIPLSKLDILIHPNSLVHAIVKFKNGLTKFVYHDTSMIIPLANAIFEGHLNIEDFFVHKNINKIEKLKNLIFKKVDKKIFPIIKLKNRVTEFPSTSIIINAANEILVNEFLKKKLPFLNINKHIFAIMRDRNYKKYAIKNPKNIKDILKIDNWAKSVIKKKL